MVSIAVNKICLRGSLRTEQLRLIANLYRTLGHHLKKRGLDPTPYAKTLLVEILLGYAYSVNRLQTALHADGVLTTTEQMQSCTYPTDSPPDVLATGVTPEKAAVYNVQGRQVAKSVVLPKIT